MVATSKPATRARIASRTAAIALSILCACVICFGARELYARQQFLNHEHLLANGLSRVSSGMTRADVQKRIGSASFQDFLPNESFMPNDTACRAEARSVLVFQQSRRWFAPYPPRPSVAVFLNSAGRVVCVERSNVYRVLSHG